MNWKTYEPIPAVVTFDSSNLGPTPASMQIIANVSLDPNYPEARIGILVNGLGSVCLTEDQCLIAEQQLAQARRAVKAARFTPPRIAKGTEGKCESCAVEVAAGESVVVEDAGTGDQVVLHAGECPAERMS